MNNSQKYIDLMVYIESLIEFQTEITKLVEDIKYHEILDRRKDETIEYFRTTMVELLNEYPNIKRKADLK